jgi:hypothetical protein
VGTQPTTDLETLNTVLQAIVPNAKGKRQLPPVESWNPEHCADIGLEIRKDGSWWHEGTRFQREKLVDLFATILRKDEDGSTYLVTPYEKVIVHVETAPFLGVRLDRAVENGVQVIVVTTNLGDTVEIGAKHPLRVETDAETGGPSPFVLIRGGLEAKLTRAAFYELVDYADIEGDRMSVTSHGERFDLGDLNAE